MCTVVNIFYESQWGQFENNPNFKNVKISVAHFLRFVGSGTPNKWRNISSKKKNSWSILHLTSRGRPNLGKH